MLPTPVYFLFLFFSFFSSFFSLFFSFSPTLLSAWPSFPFTSSSHWLWAFSSLLHLPFSSQCRCWPIFFMCTYFLIHLGLLLHCYSVYRRIYPKRKSVYCLSFYTSIAMAFSFPFLSFPSFSFIALNTLLFSFFILHIFCFTIIRPFFCIIWDHFSDHWLCLFRVQCAQCLRNGLVDINGGKLGAK